jgi:hypothetical protein
LLLSAHRGRCLPSADVCLHNALPLPI